MKALRTVHVVTVEVHRSRCGGDGREVMIEAVVRRHGALRSGSGYSELFAVELVNGHEVRRTSLGYSGAGMKAKSKRQQLALDAIYGLWRAVDPSLQEFAAQHLLGESREAVR